MTVARKRSKHVGPDDEVGEAGLVLERGEDHALGAAGALADQDQAADRDPAAGVGVPELAGGDGALGGEPVAQQRQRVGLQGQAQGGVVLDDMLAQAHRRQLEPGLVASPRSAAGWSPGGRVAMACSNKRQGRVLERLDRPQRLAAVEPERAERVGLGQPDQGRAAQARAALELLQRAVGLEAGGDEPMWPPARAGP